MLRLLLAPFAWLYGAVLLLRHALYDQGFLRRSGTRIPSIGVGNLALGGTGKTPHVELVLRTLEGIAPIATLSRGYGRKANDIREVRGDDGPAQVGDEPLLLKKKFPAVRVWVGADRVAALEKMVETVPALQAVVLDDAFQHRRMDAGLDILLTTWHRPWHRDALLPAGRLRDLPARARFADVVIVTKSPALPAQADQLRWREELGLRPGQPLFFSGITYGELRVEGTGRVEAGPDDTQPSSFNSQPATALNILLTTGIADPAPLVDHLRSRCATLDHAAFPDHHAFTPDDLRGLAARYANFATGPKVLVTTEKDAMRLLPMVAGSPLEGLPLAVIPMKALILNEPERFAALIRDHVATHPADR
ncbi:MAG: tetraacyldisaccharide 4'-kinase [Flavobacteriales bacterium]|nr:tetraacyldisaccharide 4'-kinase [Flavobacteriales bacterium]